ncbi:hypothetical protein ACFCP7_21940 [Paenibacillus elgii]
MDRGNVSDLFFRANERAVSGRYGAGTRAPQRLYAAENKKDGNPLAQHALKWSPYCIVASLYLWEAVNCGYVDSGKTVEELVSG